MGWKCLFDHNSLTPSSNSFRACRVSVTFLYISNRWRKMHLWKLASNLKKNFRQQYKINRVKLFTQVQKKNINKNKGFYFSLNFLSKKLKFWISWQHIMCQNKQVKGFHIFSSFFTLHLCIFGEFNAPPQTILHVL